LLQFNFKPVPYYNLAMKNVKPIFAPKIPGEVKNTPQSKEIEMGTGTGKFDDGRVYIAEQWFDSDTETINITFFYTTFGIESWAEKDHLDYVARHELLTARDKKHINSTPGIKKVKDEASQEMWSVTFVMNEEE